MFALSINVFFIKATSPCSPNLMHPVANIHKDKTSQCFNDLKLACRTHDLLRLGLSLSLDFFQSGVSDKVGWVDNQCFSSFI